MTEDLTTLRLEGALTIKTAAETRDRLLAAFQSAKTDRRPLEIEIAEDCDCDLTLPQLLLSAKATAAKDGIDLRIRADARGRFSTTLERAGLSAAVEGGSLVTMNGDQR
ncbi:MULTISPECIES: STAS domain-containing protein [Rhizobium]|nr:MULTISPECIES: STAS domain-containing protein [Rhizobium]RKE77514.1 STAS domain-containing protein [Rhizobium sp. AG855]